MIVRQNLPPDLHHCYGSFCAGYVFSFPEIDIRIGGFDSVRNSSKAVKYTIQTRFLSRRLFNSLNGRLKEITSAHAMDQNHYGAIYRFLILLLHVAEEGAAHLPKYNLNITMNNEPKKWHAIEAHWDEVKYNNAGVDLSTIPNTAQDILGLSPQEICENLLPDYRIIHVESVLRSDLCRRYLERQAAMRESLMSKSFHSLRKHIPHEVNLKLRGNDKSKMEEVVTYLTSPKVTFHGTVPHHIPSIIQHGFLKPGDVHPITCVPLGVRCGSTYGRGIYSSPNAGFALNYSGEQCVETKPEGIPGLKLLICATIMGRSAQIYRPDDWRNQSEPYHGADSHVANDGMEYIVFNNAQILPCYVVHLDWGLIDDPHAFVKEQMAKPVSRGKTSARLSLGRQVAGMFPGDRQRLKEERLAQARKFFAYGFGPVSGKHIVIEDIAEIDDDEEDYGQYQQDRVENNAGEVDIWKNFQLSGYTEMDEYASARKAKNKRVLRQEDSLDSE